MKLYKFKHGSFFQAFRAKADESTEVMAPPRRPGKAVLAEMDETLCVVLFGGQARIFSWTESPVFPGTKIPDFATREAMGLYFANQIIKVREGNKIVDSPAFQVWLKRPSAPRAKGVTLNSSGSRFVNGQLNLWTGFGVEPKSGSWPLLRQHITDVTCNSDNASSEYMLKWLAWVVQNPTKCAEVAVVMRGLKGTGKGTLGSLLCRIFANQALHISSRKHLVGTFNRHLMNCCFLFADEAFWAGDHAGAAELQRMVTERTLLIEPKGINSYQAINNLSIIMASNEDWVVPASGGDERRYAVFDVSDKRRGDRAYFNALQTELYKDGGAAAFLDDVLAADLGDWHPREDVPQTKGLAAQKMESAAPEVNWLWALLEDGHRTKIHAAALLREAKQSDARLRYLTPQKFSKFLKLHNIVKVHRKEGDFLVFPPLLEARARFHELYPWFDAFTEGAQEWQIISF